MKRFFIFFVYIVIFAASFLTGGFAVIAQTPTPVPTSSGIDYIRCQGGCIPELESGGYYKNGESCTPDYNLFKQNPYQYHHWVYDAEITQQGKADERARQFLYWVLTHPSIDDHPTLKGIWTVTRNVAYFLILLVSIVMGIGIIVAQRQNFSTKIEVPPLVVKLIIGLLYITFSGTIIIAIIQISEVLMRFFIDTLGGKDLFNIYFTTVSGENNYINWIGCRDLNVKVQEAVNSELFLLKVTNITYYVMGIMILLRKILLWFLLFVSPFLAVLMPFVFIRNIGWIWIGVFFQWVFYGPLFALFLGALARIWKGGIPFPFNFSRTNTPQGYVFPTGMNIGYAGPAQVWDPDQQKYVFTNNGNYVDTFVEYIITLLMLWAVTFFPWWLLRIFRDYCCDGIYAMKNILLSMYDQARGGSPKGPPGPMPIPGVNITGTALKMPREVEAPVKVRLETLEEVRKTSTTDISKSLNLSVSKLTDIARFETNKQSQEVVRKNINMLSNPVKAETPTERQKFMNVRTELFNRAVKNDTVAKQILSSTSTSRIEQIQKRSEMFKETPVLTPITHIVSIKVKMPQAKVSSVSSQMITSATSNTQVTNTLSQSTQTPVQQVRTILTSFTQHVNESPGKIVENISKETGIEKTKVKQVITQTATILKTDHELKENSTIQTIAQESKAPVQQVRTVLTSYKKYENETTENKITQIAKETGIEKTKVAQVVTSTETLLKTNKDLIQEVAQKENIKVEEVQKIIDTQMAIVAEPEKHIEQSISIPSTVSLEDYEEVKKMWTQQYEKGEVPVTENVATRADWIDQDTVFITNTLNKLLSSEEKLRNEGMDELGFILPIFMLNNLKGEELLVYLKAKLEAAKAVAEQMQKEKDLTEKLKQKVSQEEEFVEVKAQKKKETPRTMTMEDEMKIDDNKEKTDKDEKPEKVNNPTSEISNLQTDSQNTEQKTNADQKSIDNKDEDNKQ